MIRRHGLRAAATPRPPTHFTASTWNSRPNVRRCIGYSIRLNILFAVSTKLAVRQREATVDVGPEARLAIDDTLNLIPEIGAAGVTAPA